MAAEGTGEKGCSHLLRTKNLPNSTMVVRQERGREREDSSVGCFAAAERGIRACLNYLDVRGTQFSKDFGCNCCLHLNCAEIFQVRVVEENLMWP